MTQSEIDRRVKEYLQERFVTLIVELTTDKTRSYIYSGSVVEIGDNWIWLTAGHNVENIQTWLEHAETRVAFGALSADCSGRVDITRSELQMVNMQDRLREYRERWPAVQITDRQIELYDVGFAIIPTLRKLYLMNKGVKPFKLEQCIPSPEALIELTKGHEAGIFVGGVPDSSHVFNDDEMTVSFQFFAFPLHPDPDTTPELEDRRVIRFEGQYTWIPTTWKNITGDIVGVSGGPVVIFTAGKFFLTGIATRQEPAAPRTPQYVGVTDGHMTLEFLRDIVLETDVPAR